MPKIAVPLKRTFSPCQENGSDEFYNFADDFSYWQYDIGWERLEKLNRIVILAEAGAGKTFEMKARADSLREHDFDAFLIRIEDIEPGFEDSFEIGNSTEFKNWLNSSSEGWFFLDSIDEARLKNPRTFESALKRFGSKIRSALQRSHIIISSRPYSWRNLTDREIVEKYLPYSLPKKNAEYRNSSQFDESESSQNVSALKVFNLNPLTTLDIRQFASFYNISDIDTLIDELERTNLSVLSSRPFDLEGILDKWNSENKLGGRLEQLEFNIKQRLKEINPDRTLRQPLSLEKAENGAMILAATITMTGKNGIWVPNGNPCDKGIDAQDVLKDWNATDIDALLGRAIFCDQLYGMVRFRHREVRELLTAKWIVNRLENRASHEILENLIVRKKFGETVIAPRIRSILPWLILFDSSISEVVLKLAPEIAYEGGDASRLRLNDRISLLEAITVKIADDIDETVIREHEAILRIARPDLAKTTASLIKRFWYNDTIIFFLARIVLYGRMYECIPQLREIAFNCERELYARVVSIRAIIAIGTSQDREALWTGFSGIETVLPRRIFDELIDCSEVNHDLNVFVTKAIEKLKPCAGFEIRGVSKPLHKFIDRLSVNVNDLSDCPVATLLGRLIDLLNREPLSTKYQCTTSESYIWLLPYAAHAISRLVERKSPYVLRDEVLSTMHKIAQVRDWKQTDRFEFETKLSETIPKWPTLNDKLFWNYAEYIRLPTAKRKARRISSEWQLSTIDHVWNFDTERFDDVLNFIDKKKFLDDKLVALTLGYRLYLKANKNEKMKAKLEHCVKGNLELENQLAQLLTPVQSKEERKWQKSLKETEKKQKRKRAQKHKERLDWIQSVKCNPNRVRSPNNLKPGQITYDQYWLCDEIRSMIDSDTNSYGAYWEKLIPEFGKAVAEAYRDAAIKYWRNYKPKLGSEGANLNSIPAGDTFGLAGIQIESELVSNFWNNLSPSDVETASRYLKSELNGFPEWYESLFNVHPKIVSKVIKQELKWELEAHSGVHSTSYILQDIVYYAPWVHETLGSTIISWLQKSDNIDQQHLRYLIRILLAGKASNEEIGIVAKHKVSTCTSWQDKAFWFSVWVDVDADVSLSILKKWLSSCEENSRSESAQLFLQQLVGTRISDNGYKRENYRNVSHLKELYQLMHTFVPTKDDINRVDTGVYIPGLRDDAQEAREMLLTMLSQYQGKEVYLAFKQLAETHPDENQRPWMKRRARQHLEVVADIEAWTEDQIYEFDRDGFITPQNHQQLFDIVVKELIHLKRWLETGNDSPYVTWRKVENESEMRNLIAGVLNKSSGAKFTCTQENELANKQKPDILIQSPNVNTSVPIELKLLDKGWSGPKLCERLRNQLAGDYLRDEDAKGGILLLFALDDVSQKSWRINKKSINKDGLADALSSYWNSISHRFPSVDDIEVILVDLTARANKSVVK